ncbi:MAG: SDR family oxidoreductase [Ignavibacteria bacterium]|nr:SDR family oxidoreductase [Ignavibacteria bacterium]
MRYLVTGAAGFIGSNIMEELLRRGLEVRGIDNFATGRRENVEAFLSKTEFIEGDIRDAGTMRKAMAGIDVILHQAAIPSVPRSISDPVTTNDVNVNGTLNILNIAREAGVRRIVNASSSSVYGDSPTLPKNEEMATNPLSPYAVSKLAAERYCSVFSKIYGLEAVSLRYFNVFGPRQDPTSQYSAVIPKFIKAMQAGDQPMVYGDGEQSRDFTYVANVVEANLLAAEAEFEAGVSVNCACHERTTLNDLVKQLNVLLGTKIAPQYADPRPGDIKHSYADIGLAKKTIGFSPAIGFRKGLELTVDWYGADRNR